MSGVARALFPLLFFIGSLSTLGAQTEDLGNIIRSGIGDDVRAILGRLNKDPNQHGYTWLMEAARYNTHGEVVSVLVDGGFDVDARDETGSTALILAARDNSSAEVIQALIAAGAQVNASNTKGSKLL